MAFRQIGAARKRVLRKILYNLEGELNGLPSSSYVHSSSPFSGPYFSSTRYFASRHQVSSCVSAAAECILHPRDSEKSIIVPRHLDLGYRTSGSGERTPFQSRILQDFLAGSAGGRSPGLNRLTDGKFDPLGTTRREFFSYTRVTLEPAQSSASRVSPKQSEEEEDEAQMKRRMDASAADCDEAVVGLTSASEKAKQKQKLEAAKKSEGYLSRAWSMLLGIGPALRQVAAMSREDWAKKLTGWRKHIWEALQHYWLGTKLLWADVRISSRLLLKLASGKSLSRRERQQLTTTAADIFRLVPFAVFIIVPFMELLLPVALRLFPNMLPSTFQDKMKEQEKLKKKLNARIQYAKFLQDTVGEMARELKGSRSGELQKKASDLDKFMTKVRTGAHVGNEEILAFGKLFNDELTLDNISRPRLISMCKYMGIQPYGTDAYLRYSLRTKLREIKTDDRMIQAEGVDSLSDAELRAACQERGMLGLLSPPEMRVLLEEWLELSLTKSLPSSLLILSRAFMVSGKVRSEEAMQAALSSLPDQVVESVSALTPSEELAERQRKLEYLREQEALIKEEEARAKENLARSRDDRQEQQLSEEVNLEGVHLTISDEARHIAQQKAVEKQEELCKISRALAVLASASSVSKERSDFLRLVNTEIRLYNNMIEKEGTPDEEIAREAYRHARDGTAPDEEEDDSESRVSSALIKKVDAMLHKLEKELDDVDAEIGDRWRILDRDHDGKVTAEEVAAAATYLRDTLGQENLQHLISNLAKDQDGKILVEDIVKLGSILDEYTEDTEHGDKPKQLMST